jgi:hypothetical protein
MTGADAMRSAQKPRDMVLKYSDMAQATSDARLRAQFLELAARYLELAEAAEMTDRLGVRPALHATGQGEADAS